MPITSPFRRTSHSRSSSADDVKRTLSSNTKVESGGQPKRTQSQSLFEQYERDKNGIIRSCFGKLDPRGKPLEIHYTHVRVVEDSHYPSSRPPPSSSKQHKKQRMLIVGLKTDTNKYYIHKGKEVSASVFQIGRTWKLEELTLIERDPENDKGVLFFMGKRYYWEMNSARERDTFVKSVVKLYMESNSKVPQLKHWDLGMFYLDEQSYQRAVIKSAPPSAPASTSTSREVSQAADYNMVSNYTQQKPPTLAPAVSSAPRNQAAQSFSRNQEAQPTPKSMGSGSNVPTSKSMLFDSIPSPTTATTPKTSLPGTHMSASRSMLFDTVPSPSGTTPKSMHPNVNVPASKSMLSDGVSSPTTSAPKTLVTEGNIPTSGVSSSFPKKPAQSGSSYGGQVTQGMNTKTPPLQGRPFQGTPSQNAYQTPGQNAYQTPGQNAYQTPGQNAYQTPGQNAYQTPGQNAYQTAGQNYDVTPVQKTTGSSVGNSVQVPRLPYGTRAGNSSEDLGSVSSGNSMGDRQRFKESQITQTKSVSESPSSQDLLNVQKTRGPRTPVELPSMATVPDVNAPEMTSIEPISGNTPQATRSSDTLMEELNHMLESPTVADNTAFSHVQRSRQDILRELDLDDDRIPPANSQINVNIQPDLDDYYGDDDDEDDDDEEVDEVESDIASYQGHDDEEPEALDTIQEKHYFSKSTDQLTNPDAPHILEDPVIVEVLDELNWNVEDDAETLIKKLTKKLSGMDYEFNRRMVSLPVTTKRLDTVSHGVQKECDALGPSLSYFSMELSSFKSEIDYVENERHGLQVETSNKKALWGELAALLKNVSVDERSLHELLGLPISEKSLGRIEELLCGLYTALKSTNSDDADGLGDMRSLSERRYAYDKVSVIFLTRTIEELDRKFADVCNLSGSTFETQLGHLLVYSSLALFCKEISETRYKELLDKWNVRVSPTYRAFTDQLLRKVIGDSKQFPFVFQGFLDPVDTSKLLKSITSGSSVAAIENAFLDMLFVHLKEFQDILIVNQNFVDQFFHLSKAPAFDEFVKQVPVSKRSESLKEIGGLASDRQGAQQNFNQMSLVFQDDFNGFSKAILEVLKLHQIYTPSVMTYIEYMAANLISTDQEFLVTSLKKLSERLRLDWYNFIDEQSRIIGRASINYKERMVHPACKNFSHFVKSNEEFMSYVLTVTPRHKDVDTRQVTDDSYSQLSDALVEMLSSKNLEERSISNISNEGEDSTELNRTITLLMNTHWLTTTLQGHSPALIETKKQIKGIFDEEKEKYASYLLRQKMGKLMEFIDGVEGLLNTSASRRIDPSKTNTYSTSNMQKVLSAYTSKEIRNYIQEIHENVLAHFAHEESPKIKKVLIEKMWSTLQGSFVSSYLKLYSVIDKYYRDCTVEFSKNDVIGSFTSLR